MERYKAARLAEGAATGTNPDECRGPTDVGKMYHDEERDVWYECVFDQRKAVYTWTILPPGESTGPSDA